MIDPVAKWNALIEKDLGEHFVEAASLLDEMAVHPDVRGLTGPTALSLAAVHFRQKGQEILSRSPPENLFMEIGILAGQAEKAKGLK